MTREQKRSLLLIAAAAVLLIGLHFVPVTGWLKLCLLYTSDAADE